MKTASCCGGQCIEQNMEEIIMKKIGVGIGILLFAILFELCSSGLETVSLIIGLAGLVIVILGGIEK